MFATRILTLIFCLGLQFLLFDLAQTTWGYSQKASLAWEMKVTPERTIEFLPMGLKKAMELSVVFHLFSELIPESTLPNQARGHIVIAFFLAASLALITLILRTTLALFRKQEKRDLGVLATKPQQFKFAINTLILIAGGLSFIFFLQNAEVDTTKVMREPRTFGSDPMSDDNRKLLLVLGDALQNLSMTPEQMKQTILAAKEKAEVDPRVIGKVYGYALAQCLAPYLEVLEQFPMFPAVEDYDKNAMLSQYSRIHDNECDAYYIKKGWAKGCEIKTSTSPCDDFKAFDLKYLSFFESMKKLSNQSCVSVSDCIQSLIRVCGESLVTSRLGVPENWLREHEKWKCPYEKRRTICSKHNPQFFYCSSGRLQNIVCESRVCQLKDFAIPMATTTPKPVPKPEHPKVLQAQPSFYKDQEECEQIAFKTASGYQEQGGSLRDTLENLRNHHSELCSDRAMEGSIEIAHVVVKKVQKKNAQQFRISIQVIENLGLVPLPKNLSYLWPGPKKHFDWLDQKHSEELKYDVPKVGQEAILGFFDKGISQIQVEAKNPELQPHQRRLVSVDLLQKLRKLKSKYPSPHRIKQLVLAREKMKQTLCEDKPVFHPPLDGELHYILPEVTCSLTTLHDFVIVEFKPQGQLLQMAASLKKCGLRIRNIEPHSLKVYLEGPKEQSQEKSVSTEACLQNEPWVEYAKVARMPRNNIEPASP